MKMKVRNLNNYLNDKTLLVTANVGKYISYCYARTQKGEELEPFKFHNSGLGLRMIYGIIELFRKKHNLERRLNWIV